MKVCMLTTTHRPLDVRIFHKEAKSLSKFYEVVVIAPDEKSWNKIVDDVNVITVKKPKSKLLHFLTLWRVFKEGLKQDCKVYHCHEPDSLAIGVIIRVLKKGKVKLIYDVHEHWPSLIAYGWFKIRSEHLRRIIEFLSSKLELFFVRFADSIIVVSSSVGMRFGLMKDFIVVPNVPLVNRLHNTTEKSVELVQMGGSLQSYHGLHEIFTALIKVKEFIPKVKLKIIGNVKSEIKSIIDQYELTEGVIFSGFLPFERMYVEICSGKIGLVILKSEFYNAYIGLPNKLFDYMLCKLAVIASDYPEIGKIVRRAKCGILVDPNNPDEIANAIIYLLENPAEAKKMGIRGRRLVEREMNWEKMEKRFIDIYRNNII